MRKGLSPRTRISLSLRPSKNAFHAAATICNCMGTYSSRALQPLVQRSPRVGAQHTFVLIGQGCDRAPELRCFSRLVPEGIDAEGGNRLPMKCLPDRVWCGLNVGEILHGGGVKGLGCVVARHRRLRHLRAFRQIRQTKPRLDERNGPEQHSHFPPAQLPLCHQVARRIDGITHRSGRIEDRMKLSQFVPAGDRINRNEEGLRLTAPDDGMGTMPPIHPD